MLFSSLSFLYLFLPTFLSAYLLAFLFSKRRIRFDYVVIIIFSFIFYFYSSGKFLILLLISILLNYFLAQKILVSLGRIRKIMFILGVGLNLILLGYFKYSRYFLDILSSIIGKDVLVEIDPILPVGLSFFTFMAISFLFEIYKNQVSKVSLLEFSTYLTMFPHLVAGPIVRFSEIASELQDIKRLSWDKFNLGLIRFSKGLAMKVLIANNIAPVAEEVFSKDASSVVFLEAWLGAISYTFQIYFDFAAYTSMAIGLALMIGVNFPENFNRPYLSTSMTDFWRRWHMTLSRWFRDYLYIPLGGNKRGNTRTYLNLFAVFGLCGLWHGAATTFIVWGLYQGIFLVAERYFSSESRLNQRKVHWIALNFIVVIIGWVIFRSESLGQATRFVAAMFRVDQLGSFDGITVGRPGPLFWLAMLIGGIIIFSPRRVLTAIQRYMPKSHRFLNSTLPVVLLIVSTIFLAQNSFQPFIYFRF